MRIFLSFLYLLAITACAQAQNLIHNGDFELESAQSPPPGWVMWGAEQWKDRRNYTRDTTQAHSGQASLRIYQPANTGGYIVASPRDNAIATKKGMVYDISFWAKADQPGVSRFQVQTLSSIEPLVGCAVALTQSIEVGAEWRKFTFRMTESLDFFADECAYLMLAFQAAPGANAVERTLWIDDVAVEAKPAPAEILTLLSLKTIPYSPLEHRLQPDAELRITVDARRKMRRATREAEGVSFHRVHGYMNLPYNAEGEYKLTPQQEEAIRDMRLPLTRFYGLGDEPFSLESAIDKAAHVLDRTGIPQDGSVLEFEDQGARRKLAPEVWARGVTHSMQQGYKFRHWEISNEPYVQSPGHTNVFPTPEDYIEHVKAVSPAIRRVQPESRIGVGIHSSDTRWGNYILKATAGHYDFVAGHWYSFIDAVKNPFEMVVAGENYRVLDQMLRLNALLRAYNPGRAVYQYDTEWSLHSAAAGSAGNTMQNGNIVGVLHRAVRLIYYLREDIVQGASAWEMFSNAGQWNALGILPPDSDKRSMLYWLHRSVNEHTGEWVLEMQGTTPYYQPTASSNPGREPLPGPLAPAVVMLSRDEKTLYIIAANASWGQSVPCTVQVANFAINSHAGRLLSHTDPNGHPLLDKQEDFVGDLPVQANGSTVTCTLPPHSVAFITLQTAPQP